MHVKRLRIQNFRGIEDLTLNPKGNVVLMGPPGSSRSDVLAALTRVLDPDAWRTRTTTELDFHKRRTDIPISIQVVLGALGDDLEQMFLDQLEAWDANSEDIVDEAQCLDDLGPTRHEWVLRLEYRAKWLDADERAEEFAFYPKSSDPAAETFVHVRRRDVLALGFTDLRTGTGRLLDLGERGAFRRIVEQSSGGDFEDAVENYVAQVTQAASGFTQTAQLTVAIKLLMEPLLELLRLKPTDLANAIAFSPEGGAPTGLLRSLGPSLDLMDGSGPLPAWRRGSTISTLLRTAEAMALAADKSQLIAIDDLGDNLDSASAVHLASLLQRRAGQCWISTRTAAVAEIFEPQEIFRLAKDDDGQRVAHQGRRPTSKVEAITAKHWHRNLLPALSYRTVVVLEGPNDFAALNSLSIRLSREQSKSLPATLGSSLIHAGGAGSGGYPNVLKLADAARSMGLRAVGVVDGDTDPASATYLHSNHGLADVVVRLPDGVAIERALLRGLADATIIQTLNELASALGLKAPENFTGLSAGDLEKAAVKFIKDNALHAQFVEALPAGELPALATLVLERSLHAANDTTVNGVIQLES
jgi:putative ATP-dependent endonuclease of OLD family